MIWFVVAGGAALGGIARHALNQVVHQRLLAATFPVGIFLVNVIGSCLIGLLAGLVVANRISLGPNARAFMFVGVLGGFTTFSSFSFDTLALVRDGHLAQAILNVAGQVGLSLLAVWIGYRVGLSA